MISRFAHSAHGLLLTLVFALVSLACRNKGDMVAELERTQGSVERDHKDKIGKWEGAESGASFVMGDGVRTGTASKAMLRLFDKSTLDLDPKTVVRFLNRPSGKKGPTLDVEMGQATLEAGQEVLELEMSVGSARIDARGKVRLTRAGESTRFEVVIGSASILKGDERLELKVGEAVDIVATERLAPPPASASAPLPSASAEPVADVEEDAGAPEEPVPSGDAAGTRVPGPAVVDVVVGAGESVIVHDPKPPTAIGFSQSKCSGGSILTLSGKRTRETVGTGRVSAEFPAGSHRYVISCLGDKGQKGERVASGTMTVLADSGSRKLARTAPVTNVDADGRRYTVLYQTLLPKISVRWPNAPAAASYSLNLRSPAGQRTMTSGQPSVSFAAGAVTEGDHTLVFEGGGQRSKATSLSIRFDNAAPTASISSPADGSFGAGASVLVSGSALPGWKVSAGGQELVQDAQNRFSGQVNAPSAERALVIRFSHAGRGMHYYLRRSAR